MEIKNQIVVRAPRAKVFSALQDPAVLAKIIPGCEALNPESSTEFRAVMNTKVGPLSARFVGRAAIIDIVTPERFTLAGEGKAGPVGFGKVLAHIVFEETDDDTLLSYVVKADMGGKLAQLGASVIERTSAKLAAQLFGSLEALLSAAEDGATPSMQRPTETVAPQAPAEKRGAGTLAWVAFACVAAAAVWIFTR